MSVIKESEHVRKIPFLDIKEATKNFTTKIGEGGYGPVFKGELSLSGHLTSVAVKRLNYMQSGQGLKEFLTERQLLSSYKHPNLVCLLGYCDEGHEKILIYEYAERGSFENYLDPYNKNTRPLTWKQRINICIDVARGLDYLHNPVVGNQRVIHRDIKSANILIDQNWKAMISDLGLSKLGRANENVTYLITNPGGTLGYCDPAYFSDSILTKESDVYSFGVVLFEALCGRLFFVNVSDKKQLFVPLARRYYEQGNLDLIMDLDLKKDSEYIKEFSKIAYQCVNADRKGRPSMDVVLQKLQMSLELFEIEEPCILKERQEALRLQEYADACELQLVEDALGLQKLVENLQVPVIVEAFLLQELDDAMEMQELVEALEFHKLGKILELERDYASIKAIHMMSGSRPTYTTKEEIYTHLFSGILLDDGKTWFSIDEYGNNQEMISAMKFMPPDPNICELVSGYGNDLACVFPMVARILKASKVNMQVKIRTQFLSPNVSYAAYLVCKHEHPVYNNMIFHSIKYKLNNRSRSYISHPRYRYGKEWMMMELFQINSLKRRVEFEVLLDEFHFTSYIDEVIVQGIVFLPIQKFDGKIKIEEMKSRPRFETEWENRLPSDYKQFVYYSGKMMEKNSQDCVIKETKEEAYTILSRGIYIKTKFDTDVWFWITQSNGKKCFMLSPKSIQVEHDRISGQYTVSELRDSNESRFKYVLDIKPSRDLGLTWNIASPLLSANTSYVCYLVYKIPQAFDYRVNVNTHHGMNDVFGTYDVQKAHLYLGRPKSPLVIGPNIAEGSTSTSTINKVSMIEVPRKRKDGWLEVMLWKSTTLDEPTTLYERLIENSSQWICTYIPCFSSNDGNDYPFANMGVWTIYRDDEPVGHRTGLSALHTDLDHHFNIWLSCNDQKEYPIKIPNLTVQGIEIREL